ncbi:anti-sigma factor family protein [Streptomyces sp. t39]|uniref:anti-sigma factor family protein n=1 Tax=Streptomyces sp. t39 TaxID=1828156 RepID=UPI0011CEC71C|nr:zf-HC2 domain-containing protein [Streptomyces sp. t39]TXS49133.1 zf-HC2 domain-containing protein [Streptomyces sp. t39]
MSSQQPHRDVAAYALGVLEPGDALRFEEHLGECARCTAHLSDFTGVARAVAELAGPGRTEALPSAGLLEGLTQGVRARRRRDGRRRLRLAAVAAVLVVGTPVAVVAARDPAPVAVQRVVAKDPVSGVRASVALEDHNWGTEVAMRLTALPGPRVCRLVAIGKDGAEHPVLSWWVPDGGYGVADGPGRAGPLDVTGGTDLHPAEIGRWEVRGENGERLLSIGG